METPVNNSLKRYKGKWSASEAAHLLRRTMFGAPLSDMHYFASISLKQALHELVDTNPAMPQPPINNYNDDKYTDEEIPAGQTWVTAGKTGGMNAGRRRNSYKSWWIGCQLNQQKSIREKMVLFWHNHFATETNSVDNPTMCYKHNILLREHALGNFKEMVKAITLDPAMLKYLNGNASTRKAPDENYGRELQELFTVGKGPGSHYTEADVKAAARILTGFRIDNKILPEVHGYFDPGRHDEEEKQFSAFYGNTLVKGRKGEDAKTELDDMLEMIFNTEEVSKFICRKLYRFFVYAKIDDDTEKNIILPLARQFRKSRYEIRPVLKRLLASRHFFDPANRGAMIKTPLDYTVGYCREMQVNFPTMNSYVEMYGHWNNIQVAASQMQLNIGDPPNVAGWPAWYQSPQFDKTWINSDTLPRRSQFTDRMINNGFNRNGNRLVADPYNFAQALKDPGDPDALIAESAACLLAVDLPEEEKKYMKEGILLSGLQGMNSDHYWTDAWERMKNQPDDKANKKDLVNKLRNLYQYMTGLPQYQLC